jgi:hypothetical protein
VLWGSTTQNVRELERPLVAERVVLLQVKAANNGYRLLLTDKSAPSV